MKNRFWVAIRKNPFPYIIDGREVRITSNAYEYKENDKDYLFYKTSPDYKVVEVEMGEHD